MSWLRCQLRWLHNSFAPTAVQRACGGGARGIIKNHFDSCGTIPSHDHVKILGKNKGEKLLSLEALFINKLEDLFRIRNFFSTLRKLCIFLNAMYILYFTPN